MFHVLRLGGDENRKRIIKNSGIPGYLGSIISRADFLHPKKPGKERLKAGGTRKKLSGDNITA